MDIANCKQCGKLYRPCEITTSTGQIVHRPAGAPKGLAEQIYTTEAQAFCYECFTVNFEHQQSLYQYLQDHPGVSIEELAEAFDMDPKDMQFNTLLSEIGTAKNLFNTRCSRCHKDLVYYQRSGHYCRECNAIMKIEITNARTSARKAPSAATPPRKKRENDGQFGFKSVTS